MIYGQIKAGQKLHLAYEAGEGKDNAALVRKGYLSPPLCGTRMGDGYRMNINLPLGNACQNCLRVFRSRIDKGVSR